MKEDALPRADNELWRRTKPDLFHLPGDVASDPLRVAGPGMALPGVIVVPLGADLEALPFSMIVQGTNLHSHGLIGPMRALVSCVSCVCAFIWYVGAQRQAPVTQDTCQCSADMRAL